MAPGASPGELEQMILLAILGLDDEAFALSILRELDREAVLSFGVSRRTQEMASAWPSAPPAATYAA